MRPTDVDPGEVPRHRTLAGAVRIFLAECLIIPSGLFTAAYLARRLGPEGYGLFAVAAALVAWIEWSLSALFARVSVKFVADAADWRPIGSTILSAQLLVSLAAALTLALAAPVVAGSLGVPAVTGYLRLFALDIPVFGLAQVHRNILVGLGSFSERAYAAAARWISRLAIIVLLVELGWSIEGAILGSVGASVVELAVARRFVQPTFSPRAVWRVRPLLGYAAPLLVSALSLRLFDKLDLITLTALGTDRGRVGLYAAAQNLSILPGLFALSFSPLLLSELSRAARKGDIARTRTLGREAMRGLLLLVPFAALVAGSASEIVTLLFGPAFAAAALVLPWLIGGAVALVFVSVTIAMLTAAGMPWMTIVVATPVPVLALPAYVAVIPRAGPTGVAMVTSLCAFLGAVAGGLAVSRVCRITAPRGTVIRTVFVSVCAYAAAVLWTASGWLILFKLPVIGLAILVALGALGEFSGDEIATMLRSLRRRRTVPA